MLEVVHAHACAGPHAFAVVTAGANCLTTSANSTVSSRMQRNDIRGCFDFRLRQERPSDLEWRTSSAPTWTRELESFLSPSTMFRARVITACIVSATGFASSSPDSDGADVDVDAMRGVDRNDISLCFFEQGRDRLELGAEGRRLRAVPEVLPGRAYA